MISERKRFTGILITILVSVAVFVVGCPLKRASRPSLPYVKPADSTPNVDPSRVHMASRLDALEQELARIRDTIERLQANQGSRVEIKDLENRVAFIERQLGIEQGGSAGVTDTPARDPAGKWQARTRKPPKAVAPVTPGSTTNPPEQPVQITEPPEEGDEEAYREAYGLFRKRQLGEAVKLFEKFVKEHPKSKFTANSIYWLGEALSNQGRHAEAVLQFDRVIKEYPGSKKVVSAYLRQGQAFQKMGDPKSARIVLDKLIKEYPHTPQARIARKTINTLSKPN